MIIKAILIDIGGVLLKINWKSTLDLLNLPFSVDEAYELIEVQLPFKEGALIALFHEQGHVENVEHTRSGVVISGRLPTRLVARYRPFENVDETEYMS